jgi:prepilin-type N-terminal cleavage/methylation domain-containing protein
LKRHLSYIYAYHLEPSPARLPKERGMILRKNTAGFTLVEIMIVVAIIGLLAAIAVPNFVQARTTTRTNACRNNLRLIDAAKEQWAMENNQDTGADPATAVNGLTYLDYLKGGAVPTCPSSGTYTPEDIGTAPTCSIGGDHAL